MAGWFISWKIRDDEWEKETEKSLGFSNKSDRNSWIGKKELMEELMGQFMGKMDGTPQTRWMVYRFFVELFTSC